MIRRLMRGAIMRRALRPRGFLYTGRGPVWMRLMTDMTASVMAELSDQGMVSLVMTEGGIRIEATPAARLESEIVEDLERW